MKTLLGPMLLILLTFLNHPAAANDWVNAGPIWNDFDAKRKCPQACENGKWDGNWKTTVPGKMSVCSCSGSRSQSKVKAQKVTRPKKVKGGVDGGSIWLDMMAEQKCPNACKPRQWDGRWSYGDINHSTCYCK